MHFTWGFEPCPRREVSDYYRATTGNGEMTPTMRLMAGAGAGIVGMSATYPLDMVRGRLTVQDGSAQQYRGIAHAARVIIKEVCGKQSQTVQHPQCFTLVSMG